LRVTEDQEQPDGNAADRLGQPDSASVSPEAMRLRRAGLPPVAFGSYPDTLFDRTLPVVTDRLRSAALACLEGLLFSIGERLVYDVEDFGKALDLSAAVARLIGHEVLRDPALVAALFHRAEEHGVEDALAKLSADNIALGEPTSGDRPFEALQKHDDPEVRRRGLALSRLMKLRRAEPPRLLAEELPGDIAADLHWLLAAELGRGRDLATEAALAVSAERVLAERDILRAAQHLCVLLAQRLAERDELTDSLPLRLLAEGELLLAITMLAVRAEVSTGTAWVVLIRGETDAQIALLSGAGLSEPVVERTLALLRTATGQASSVSAARESVRSARSAFDRAHGKAALEWWRLDPRYRSASGRL
jgi:hypothetical protein